MILAVTAALVVQSQPNIVVILADDLGYGDLGSYGQKWIQTPNLDKMAREGTRFTRFYSGSTVCAPARDTLLTGRTTGHSWMRGNHFMSLRPDPEDLTIATALKRVGYRTAMIGKSCVQCESEDVQVPHQKGFEHFFGQLGHTPSHFHYPRKLYRNGKEILYTENNELTGQTYDHRLFIDDALAYISRPSNKPFFLLYSATIPHASLTVPMRWKRPYIGKFDEKPYVGNHYNSVRDPIATYAGMVTRLDYDVGEIIRRLKVTGKDKNTLVLFMSDNGGMNEGGYNAAYLNSNGGLRGTKRDLYEGGIRVPLQAWWPGKVEANRVSRHIGAFWDIFPTLAQLGGAPIPKGLDGVSLLPELLGMPGQKQHAHLYWEFHELGGKRAVRFGDWKAVQLQVGQFPNGPVELYNLASDRAETRNVAAANPDLVQKARQLFKSSRTPHPIFNFGARHNN